MFSITVKPKSLRPVVPTCTGNAGCSFIFRPEIPIHRLNLFILSIVTLHALNGLANRNCKSKRLVTRKYLQPEYLAYLNEYHVFSIIRIAKKKNNSLAQSFPYILFIQVIELIKKKIQFVIESLYIVPRVQKSYYLYFTYYSVINTPFC